jgi:hypothetical protein
MKKGIPCLLFLVVAGLLTAETVQAQGTAFTYQGRLNTVGGAANGSYDLTFTVYDSTNEPGTIVAGPLTNSAVSVSNGLFTVTLDFLGGVFDGNPRWLEIGVRSNGAGIFTTLSPRQALLPAPYAIAAGNLIGSLPSAQLNGVYTNAVTFNNPGNSFTGNGSGLTNVAIAAIQNATNNALAIATNAFLGTASSNAFQFLVNFFSRNTKFVDAGNGSDTNDGSVNYPWATVAEANANTPAGWTVAIAPGTYAGTATNGNVNWWLADSATVTFSWTGGCSNKIIGSGNVFFSGMGDGTSVQICDIKCHDFSTSGICTNFDNTTFLIICDTNSYLSFVGAGTGVNTLRINCQTSSVLSFMLYASGCSYMNINLCADTILTGGTLLVGSSSSFHAKKMVCSGNIISSGSLDWDVGYCQISGTFILTGTPVNFIGDPVFSQPNVTLSATSGAYQIR